MTLREARFRKGLNQYDISLKTGIPQSKISLFENHYLTPKPEEAQKIARALRLPVTELFPENGGLKNER